MKVYLGPYQSWWHSRVFKDYMDNKYNYDWEEANTPFEKLLEKIEDSLDAIYFYTINQIIKRRKRKIKVKIHSYDTWGMDSTLSYIILPMLKQLKDTKHGSPYVDQEDLPENLRFTEREKKVNDEGYYNKELNASEEEIQAVSEKFHSQWAWILDQMIWSFEQEIDEENDHKNYYDPYLPGEIVEDDGTALFDRNWKLKIGKFNKDKYETYQERKQLGFTFFGKYYQSLWD